MDIQTTTDMIVDLVKEALGNDGIELDVSANMSLIGENALLDSTGLVELCLAIEDKASEEGFDFDWTSENAMSNFSSMFRSIKSLSEEYIKQFEKQK